MEVTVEEGPPKQSESVIENSKEMKKTSRKSREEKLSKKKDEKSLENVLKAINNLSTLDEKFSAICKKYAEVVDDNKKMHLEAKANEKKSISNQSEIDHLKQEVNKGIVSRSKLENICRELQLRNKLTKEESLQRIREEEEKRKEVSAKFHATLADITALMQQNAESNAKLRDENLEMQNKFKSVYGQYELREQQVEKISKQMKLESQLAEAHLRKAKLEMTAEKELLERDKQQLMAELALCQSKILEQEKTEVSLRSQISVYFEKYDDFQNALTKSNEVYAGFKNEMEKMSKKITRLEKETSTWKQKWEIGQKSLLQLANENKQKDSKVELQARQLTQLEKLCRTLQTERGSLLQQLKVEDIIPKEQDATDQKAETVEKTEDGGDTTPKSTAPATDISSENNGEKKSTENQIAIVPSSEESESSAEVKALLTNSSTGSVEAETAVSAVVVDSSSVPEKTVEAPVNESNDANQSVSAPLPTNLDSSPMSVAEQTKPDLVSPKEPVDVVATANISSELSTTDAPVDDLSTSPNPSAPSESPTQIAESPSSLPLDGGDDGKITAAALLPETAPVLEIPNCMNVNPPDPPTDGPAVAPTTAIDSVQTTISPIVQTPRVIDTATCSTMSDPPSVVSQPTEVKPLVEVINGGITPSSSDVAVAVAEPCKKDVERAPVEAPARKNGNNANNAKGNPTNAAAVSNSAVNGKKGSPTVNGSSPPVAEPRKNKDNRRKKK